MRWRWARAVQSHPQVPGVPKGKEPLLPRAARPETARRLLGSRGPQPPSPTGQADAALTPKRTASQHAEAAHGLAHALQRRHGREGRSLGTGRGGGGGAPGPELTPELSDCRIVSLMGKAGRRGPGGRRKSHPSRATGHEAGCECCPQGHPAQLPALPHPCIPCSLAHCTQHPLGLKQGWFQVSPQPAKAIQVPYLSFLSLTLETSCWRPRLLSLRAGDTQGHQLPQTRAQDWTQQEGPCQPTQVAASQPRAAQVSTPSSGSAARQAARVHE